MDTYLRSLGDVKTFYAQKLGTALETFREKRPHIIFCEQSFPEGGALDFIQAIGGLHYSSEQYFVLAVESTSDELLSLAMEKGMDEILVKPFATENIQQIVERYIEKDAIAGLDWVKDLRAARTSWLEKRFQEADELFVAAARKYPDNPSVQLECAENALGQGHLQLAQGLLAQAVKNAPENARALQLLGSTYKKAGRYREAVDCFLKASALSPMNSQRNMELAETYVLLAEEQVQLALKGENESSLLVMAKARYLFLRKDYLALVTYLDAKRAFIGEGSRKEADVLVAAAKKLGGIK
jgi:tetratricopeptide (TPR) repeat protein